MKIALTLTILLAIGIGTVLFQNCARNEGGSGLPTNNAQNVQSIYGIYSAKESGGTLQVKDDGTISYFSPVTEFHGAYVDKLIAGNIQRIKVPASCQWSASNLKVDVNQDGTTVGFSIIEGEEEGIFNCIRPFDSKIVITWTSGDCFRTSFGTPQYFLNFCRVK
jgi:hypothetical protein